MSLLRTLKERTVKKVAQSHTECPVLFGRTLRLPLSEPHQPHPSCLGELGLCSPMPRSSTRMTAKPRAESRGQAEAALSALTAQLYSHGVEERKLASHLANFQNILPAMYIAFPLKITHLGRSIFFFFFERWSALTAHPPSFPQLVGG